MDNILLKYMEQRYQAKHAKKESECKGPFVTISRECGCSAIKVANLLVEKLSKETGKKWTCITKEILEQSAQELNMDRAKLEYVFDSKEKTTWDEILTAFSNKYYQSDKKIKNKISEVIHTIACRGNCIIIGRGSVVLTQDIEKSFHIKLQAPIEWRAKQLQTAYDLPLKEMVKYANEVDEKRAVLRNFFNKEDLSNSVFDLIFNAQKNTDEQIANTCVNLMRDRKII